MLCFKSLAISNFSHDLSFDLSTYDSFHQLLKEAKPLALHFDLNLRGFWPADLGMGCQKSLAEYSVRAVHFLGTPHA